MAKGTKGKDDGELLASFDDMMAKLPSEARHALEFLKDRPGATASEVTEGIKRALGRRQLGVRGVTLALRGLVEKGLLSEDGPEATRTFKVVGNKPFDPRRANGKATAPAPGAGSPKQAAGRAAASPRGNGGGKGAPRAPAGGASKAVVLAEIRVPAAERRLRGVDWLHATKVAFPTLKAFQAGVLAVLTAEHPSKLDVLRIGTISQGKSKGGGKQEKTRLRNVVRPALKTLVSAGVAVEDGGKRTHLFGATAAALDAVSRAYVSEPSLVPAQAPPAAAAGPSGAVVVAPVPDAGAPADVAVLPVPAAAVPVRDMSGPVEGVRRWCERLLRDADRDEAVDALAGHLRAALSRTDYEAVAAAMTSEGFEGVDAAYLRGRFPPA